MQSIHPGVLEAFLVLILAINVVKAANTCVKGCHQSDNGIIKFQPGNIYEYNFDSLLTVGSAADPGPNTAGTGLKILGTARIFAEGSCGFSLQLSTVKVFSAKENIEKKISQSIQKPVRFTLVSGKLGPQLCTDPHDNQYALNIKRAVISLLQSNLDDGLEVDVFGQCSTHTSTSKVGNVQTVTKVRDLNQCRYREHARSGFIQGVVNQAAGITSAQLFKSEYVKESKIFNGVVESVHLIEDYDFGIIGKELHSVQARVITNLKLKNPAGAPTAAPQTGTHVTSLIFQRPESYKTKNLVALKTALIQLVDLINGYVKEDSAKSFTELIRLMRNADTDTLLELGVVPHPNVALARKVYLDALFRTGTSESAKAILKQLNKMDEPEKLVAILSLNIVQSVDKDTLNQAASLLTPNAPKEVYLSIGTLVSTYCKENECEHADLDGISKKFIDNLKHCKANTKKEEVRIINVLKGITNMKYLTRSNIAVLAECASLGRSSRIRIVALQAFATASCDAVLTEKALALLRDRNEDFELRIEAYLAAINCPTTQLATEIEDIVNSEPIYQVGGFIATSLRVIRDSTDDHRALQRYHFANIRVKKLFLNNSRRHSYNNEVSYKLDALGLSASSDYKLIYSQHGFLPRSSKLNISTEIFGTKFNVLEVSARQENLENILEYYLGPKGLLNKDFDEIMKMIEVSGISRTSRSIADDAAKLSKKYKVYGSKNIQDINLDLSIKFFGSEMLFLSLGDRIPNSLDDIIKHISSAFDTAKTELTSFNKEFTSHNLFLDVSVVYPTGLGFPIELNTQGFAANKLDFSINLDVDAILEKNWLAPKYQLKLVPSVNIHLKLQIGFNAYVIATGLQVESSFHSTSGADVKLEFNNGENGFNLGIELPRNKLQLIHVEVIPGIYATELDKPTMIILPKNGMRLNPGSYHMCLNQMDNIGLNLCIDAAGAVFGKEYSANPVDVYSLVNPINFSIYMELYRKYNLCGSFESQKNGDSQEWKIELNTPGSEESRAVSVAVELGTNSRTYGRLSFNTPLYHFAFESGINKNNKELAFYVQYEDNDKVKRNRIGFNRNGNEYRPVIEIQDKNGLSNEINGYRVDGKIVLKTTGGKQNKYFFESLQLVNKEHKGVVVNGWTEIGPDWLNHELHVDVHNNLYLMKGNFKMNNGVYHFGFFTHDENTPDNIYGGFMHVELAEEMFVVQLAAAVASWEINSNNEVQYALSKSSNGLGSSNFKHEITIKNKKVILSQFKLNGLTVGNNKLELESKVVRGNRVAAFSAKYNGNQHVQGDYNMELHGKYNNHFVDIIAKSQFSRNRYVVDNTLTTSSGISVTVKGEIGQRYTLQDIYIDLYSSAHLSKGKPQQFVIKIIGAPDKTSSELKILRENAEVLKYNGELQHPQDKLSAGKINISLRSVVTLKGEFTIAKNGKGDASLAIETQQLKKKHQVYVNSKFLVQAPKCEIEATINVDSEQKLYIKTDSYLDNVKFSTNNVAEISNAKIAFDATAVVKGNWRTNGELESNFVFTSPTGHIAEGGIKRKVTTNNKTSNLQSSIDIELSEAHDGKKRSLTYSAKVDKFNFKTNEVSQNALLTFTNFDNKKIEFTVNVKHFPKGQGKTIEILSNLRGDFLNVPANANVVIDEYNSNHAVLRIDLNYGGTHSYSINGRYDLGDNSSPTAFEVHGKVQMPNAIKAIEFTSHGKLIKPADKSDTYIIELHIDERANNFQFFKLNTLLEGSQQYCMYTFDIETNEMRGPLKLEFAYQKEQQGTMSESSLIRKQSFLSNFNYDNMFVKTTADFNYAGTNTTGINFKLNSSFESAKNINVDLHMQKLELDTYGIKWEVHNGEAVYSSNLKFFQSPYKKGFDLHADLPNCSPIVVVGIFEILSEQRSSLLIEIRNLIELDLIYHSEAAYRAIDDFSIQANWNSAKLNLQNYVLDLQSQGKSIAMNLKHAQGVILTGSATYSYAKEKNKSIVEGQGHVQYYGKSQKANFRLLHQVYNLDVDKETGFSYILDGTFGTKKGVSTLKITNKDVDIKLSICEDKKQCTNVQLQSVVSQTDQRFDSSQHSLLIVFDLRELGYPYEFEFQSKTSHQGLILQYSLESQIVSNNDIKYKLLAQIQPKSANIQIKLPQRELVLEAKQKFPEHGKLFGKYENSIAFYFDKANNPDDVTRFKALVHITGTKLDAINVNSEVKFEHPSIRPLTISGKLDVDRQLQIFNSEVIFDIFRFPDQQIIGTLRTQNIKQGNGFNITTVESLRSTGLGFIYEFSGHTALILDSQVFSAGVFLHSGTTDFKISANAYITKDHTDVSLFILSEPIFQVTSDYKLQKHGLKIDNKLQFFSQNQVELIGELQLSQSKLTIKRKGLFDLSADVKFGKELNLNIYEGDKQLFSIHVALDVDNFLQTTYSRNKDDIKTILANVEIEIKRDMDKTVELIKLKCKHIRETIKKQVQVVNESPPDFLKLKANYESNINEIIKALGKDPALTNLIESFRNVYVKMVRIAGEVSKNFADCYANIYKSAAEIYQKLESTLKETVLPAWEDLLVTAAKVLGDLLVQIFNLVTEIFQEAWSHLQQCSSALKNYTRTVNEVLKPLNEASQEYIKELTKVIMEIIEELREYITKLPTIGALKDEFNERVKKSRLMENAVEFLKTFLDQLHSLPLTLEFTEFTDKLGEYTHTKLTNKPVNDEQVLQELWKLLVRALNSILINLNVNLASASSNILAYTFGSTSQSFNIIDKLPSLLSFHTSVINFLLNENWENVFRVDYLKSLIFLQDLNLYGHIADGHQVFTFDGQHYSFPGNCKYILVQDSVDNNFTVAVQLYNGKLKAIVLTDRDNHCGEILDSGVLKVDGNQIEYPHHSKGIHAWRLFHTIWLQSDYGVKVMCTQDLKFCNINVNGFYASKTRGLLGNGNAEPYDDFVQVDGTIASDYASLGNGYGIGKCAPIIAPPFYEVLRSEICTEIFSIESPLATGYLFENPTSYRARCDAAVSEAFEKDKEAAACIIATAYSSALKLRKIPTRLPSRCMKCSGSVGQRELGQEFIVKTPNNKADLVFVVDMNVSAVVLSNLIAPAIVEVRDALKTRGFNDVQVGVIAYNASQQYPAVLTSNGGKINYEGNIVNVQLNGPKNFCVHCALQEVADPKVVEILRSIEEFFDSIVPQSDEKAFHSALNFPFRAGAAKSIVGVRSNISEFFNLFRLIRTHSTNTETSLNGALLHLIGPVKDLSVEGIPREKLVGFNTRLIATLDGKDAKKRQKLHFQNHIGIDLVLNNGGWVFSTQNFDKLNFTEQRKTLNQVVNTLADTLFKTEIVSQCKCVPVHGLYAQHQCAIISSNFLPNKKVKGK